MLANCNKHEYETEHRKLSSQTPERQRSIVANKPKKKNYIEQCLKSLMYPVPHSNNQKLLEEPAEHQDKCKLIIEVDARTCNKDANMKE